MNVAACKKGLFGVAMLLSSVVSAESMSTTDLLNLLVREGIISEEKALQLVDNVRQRSEKEAAQSEQDKTHEGEGKTTEGAIKVPYIPPYIKQELRDEVKQSLRADVVSDVMKQAKTERWGMPNALPAWVNKFSFSGDFRLRYQGDFFPDDNPSQSLLNFSTINNKGGRQAAGNAATINVIDERHRLRLRARLKTKIKISNTVDVNLRMVTGSKGNPVSSNQTLGKWGAKYDLHLDRAYLRYRNIAKSLEMYGGRFKQPFLHTDLVWDSDMSFEGLAVGWYPKRGDDIYDDFTSWDPFIRVGLYPLEEVHQFVGEFGDSNANHDKWLYSAQVGFNYESWSQNRLSAALSYYYFDNVSGVRDPKLDAEEYRVTASSFYQNGNTVANIVLVGPNNQDEEMYALASEFALLNATIQYDYAGLSPYHVILQADYVKNMAFDLENIKRFVGNGATGLKTRDTGYQYGIAFGWPKVSVRGNWQVSLKYRYLEGDAVIDAFADSDFLLGGSNAEGYILKGDYAIMDNVAVSLKYLTADRADQDRTIDAVNNTQITGGLGVDTLQVDISAKF